MLTKVAVFLSLLGSALSISCYVGSMDHNTLTACIDTSAYNIHNNGTLETPNTAIGCCKREIRGPSSPPSPTPLNWLDLQGRR